MPKRATRGANYTGNQLEKIVKDRLDERGYMFVHRDQFQSAIYIGQPVYSRQFYLGRSIYDTAMYGDFVLFHPEKHPECLIIETKWQQVGGSVDEKYPYLILNIQRQYPYNTILLLDGGGYKKQAEQWIRGQTGNRLLHVFNMMQFQIWANKGNI